MVENKNLKEKVVIDYYDRIHHKWVKVETTKEVADFMERNKKSMWRKQNQYNSQISSLDNSVNDENNGSDLLVDENSDVEKLYMEEKDKILSELEKEHKKTIIQNALCELNDEQRKIIEMIMYKNMSYGDIAKALNISRQSVWERVVYIKQKIKKHIKNTQN